jgi:GntR family transcriptional regulator, galactonate operon transcriptional repressor
MALKVNSFSRLPNPNNLSHLVMNELGSRIVAGSLTAGETLPNEDVLTTELGVSRTVIREAVKVLSDKGLVEVRPRVGTRVRLPHAWNLLDPDVLRWQYEAGPTREFLSNVVEVRRSIEVTAAELAAVRATDGDVRLIEEVYALLAASVDDNDQYIEADLSFHESIFRACHNALLVQIAINLRIALQSSRKITVQSPNASREALPLHRGMVEAIIRHDPQAAKDATNRLIDRSVQDIDLILHRSKNKSQPDIE